MTVHALGGAGPLRLSLTRQADRFAHTLEFAAHDRLIWRLSSIEGQADQDWPVSPALQDLNLEERDGKRLALLVGQAGRSHWSLSAELDSVAACVTFDVACRVRQPPDYLGSQYLFFPAIGAGSVMAPQQAWSLPGGAVLAVEAVDGQRAELRLEAGSRLTIVPPPVAEPWPRTVRWRYALRWSG